MTGRYTRSRCGTSTCRGFSAGGASRRSAVEPTVLHHLEYGEALITLGDPAAARAQFGAALGLPARTAADRFEQARAQELLGTL